MEIILEWSSGALCRTARGAREQQSLPTWFVRFAVGPEDTQSAHSSGEWSAAWILLLTFLFAWLQSTAGIWRRRWHSGSTWTVLRLPILAYLAQSPTPMHDLQKFSRLASSWVGIRLQRWSSRRVSSTFSPLAWYSMRVHPRTNQMVNTWHFVTVLMAATGRSPDVGGAQAAPCHHAMSFFGYPTLYSGACLASCTRTTERTLRA